MLQALSFSHDGMWLLSAGKEPEQNVVIWDVETGAVLTSGATSQPVMDLAWRPHTPLPAFVTLSKVLSDYVIKPVLRCSKHRLQQLHSVLLGGNLAPLPADKSDWHIHQFVRVQIPWHIHQT